MSVVADPTALPTGAIVEGRMAFQVARNGSLIMTSRGHGQLLDQQTNLSRDRILDGDTPTDILIDGDSSAVTDADGRALWGCDHPLALVGARGPDLPKLPLQMPAKGIVHRLVQSRMTLPDWPESITSNPCWNSVQGNRCVMTGRMSSPLSSITVILYQVSYISRP